jgi:hypothetical protein
MAINFEKLTTFTEVKSPTGDSYKLPNYHVGMLNSQINLLDDLSAFSSNFNFIKDFGNLVGSSPRISITYSVGTLSQLQYGLINGNSIGASQKLQLSQKEIRLNKPVFYDDYVEGLDTLLDPTFEQAMLNKSSDYMKQTRNEVNDMAVAFLKSKAGAMTITGTTGKEIGSEINKLATNLMKSKIVELGK